MWNEIYTELDKNDFLHLFGHFHDSCIKEIRYISGAFVGESLGMNPLNSTRIVDVVFQRQCRNPSAIIMRFIGVSVLHLTPCDENYTCEIQGAKLFFKNKHIYWMDCEEEREVESYHGTWVCADKLQWRTIDAYMGDAEVFQAVFETSE